MAIDWSGLFNAGLNAYNASNTANKNVNTANQFGQQTQYNPYNIATPSSTVGFSGNNAAATLNPAYQGIQSQLTSGASGLFSGLGDVFKSGGINSYLQSSMDQYDQNQGMGQFNATSNGFLGQLGSFDPNQAASSYTNNLRAQALPQQQQAAQGLAQNLFNTGRLGSTGGANLFGQMAQAQNQQDLGFQLAGQQYGGQEQNRIAGLAQSFGQMGNQRAQQRFQNAMNLFGSGLQNQQTQLSNGLGMLQGSQGLDQNLLQAIGLGGTLGSQKSNFNQSAFNPSLQAGVAQNNTNGANLGSLLGNSAVQGALGQGVNWLTGLFGGGSSSNSNSDSGNDYTGGYGGDFSNYGTSTDPTAGGGWWGDIYGGGTGFNSAGGEAADGTISPVEITQSRVNTPENSSGSLLGNGLGAVRSGLGLINGLQQGGTEGYGQALSSGANLASLFGYGGTTTNAAGLAGNIASGNYLGAIRNAAGLLGGSGGLSAAEAANIGSGALANGALAQAGFGGGSAASAAGAGATSTGATSAGVLAGSGLSTALPLAAVGFAVANFLNAPDKKDSARVDATLSMLEKQGWQLNAGPIGRTASTMIRSPDGQYYNVGNNDNLQTFARAVTSGGSPEELQSAWLKFLTENLNTKYKGGKIGG